MIIGLIAIKIKITMQNESQGQAINRPMGQHMGRHKHTKYKNFLGKMSICIK